MMAVMRICGGFVVTSLFLGRKRLVCIWCEDVAKKGGRRGEEFRGCGFVTVETRRAAMVFADDRFVIGGVW